MTEVSLSIDNQAQMTREGHEQFSTGAVRSNGVAGDGSGFPARFDLISPVGLRRLAETYGEGSQKYGDHNWTKGIPASNLINHCLAHINQFLAGDTSEDHLAHASWNLFALMHFQECKPELMDIPVEDVTEQRLGFIATPENKFGVCPRCGTKLLPCYCSL
jgi:hypothetical protein